MKTVPEDWKPQPSSVPSLDDRTVHLWLAPVEGRADAMDAFTALLSADERQRAGRFRFPTDRARFVVARALTRAILAQCLGTKPVALEFRNNSFGKPELAEDARRIQFSVAHSGDWAVIAVAEKRKIGVDLEQIRPEFAEDDAAASFLALGEREAIGGLPPGEQVAAFFRCWTRKEAFVKARGQGLSLPLNEFEVTVDASAPPEILWAKDDPQAGNHWRLWDLPAPPGYAAALVVEGRGCDLRLWRIQPG